MPFWGGPSLEGQHLEGLTILNLCIPLLDGIALVYVSGKETQLEVVMQRR